MRYIGIDPGRQGAIAVIDEGGAVIEILPMPVQAQGPEYDVDAIADFFRTRSDRHAPDRGLHVTLERLDAMPMRFAKKGGRETDEGANVSGVVANHRRGMTWLFVGVLASFKIHPLHVRPQQWQRAMMKGLPGATTKAQSITLARKTWPGVSLRRTPKSRTDDADIADALNLAEYGRRVHQGGPMFAKAAAAGGA